ncbi:MAG: gliding motility-associated C-terminal domain-containing protein [Saprospiraceae bacterium]
MKQAYSYPRYAIIAIVYVFATSAAAFGQDCFQVNTTKSNILLSSGDEAKLPKSGDTLFLLCTKAVSNFRFNVDFKANTESFFEDTTEIVAVLDYKTSTFLLSYDKSSNTFVIPSNQVLFEGKYTLSISSMKCPTPPGPCDNCSIIYAFEVVHRYDPDFSVSIVTDPSPAILTCMPGSAVTMIGTAPPHSGFNGQWAYLLSGNFVDLPGETTTKHTTSQSGTYLYTVRGPAGCAASFFATITPPRVPKIEVDQPTQKLNACSQTIQGVTVTNGGPPGNLLLSWTTSSSGIILSGANSESPVVAALGTYTLFASRLDNGCTATATVEIVPGTIPTVVPLIVSTTGTDVLDCRNTSIKLHVSGSLSSGTSQFTYLWSDGTTGDETAVFAPGIYSVTATANELGCQGASDISIFQDITVPELQIASPRDTVCAGEAVSLNVQALEPVTYLWQNGAVTGAILAEPAQNGTNLYTVTVTANDNGCTAEASTALERLEPPQVSCMPSNLIVQTGVHLSLDCPSTGDLLVWVAVPSNVSTIPPSGSGVVMGHFFALTTPNAPGSVAYTFFSKNAGCTSEPTHVLVTVLPESPNGIFVPELVTPNGDGLNDTWEITFPSNTTNPGGYRMNLFDRNGALAFEGTLAAPVHVESLPDGAYYYTITQPDGGLVRGAVTILRRN